MQLEPEEKTKIRSDIKQCSGKKPASRWKNKYSAKQPFRTSSGVCYAPGECIGVKLFPSLDVAATHAAATVAHYERKWPWVGLQFIESFPIDGEQP
jgi:hypothetical protein